MHRSTTTTSRWAALLHPLPLAAIAVTALNDHLLKASGLFPGWLTGKLSDVAGLFFFPIAVVAALGAAPAAAAVGTALVFAVFKLSPAACAWVRPFAVTPDPTDLLALPAAAAAWWWLARRRPRRTYDTPAWARLAAVTAAALTSAATSPIRGPAFYRPLPAWSVAAPGTAPLACADLELWVNQSGREGLALTVALRPRGATCALRLDRVAIVFADAEAHAAAGFPAEIAIPDGAPVFRYVPIPFDGAAAWRRGARRAEALLDVTDPGGRRTLRFALAYAQAALPTWGIARRLSANQDKVWTELVITETAPDGVRAVVRFFPQLPCTMEIKSFALAAGERERPVEEARVGVVADLRPARMAEIPVFLPLDAARRAQLDTRDLRARVELRRDDGPPYAISWQLMALPEGTRR
jgi:hypothetical protein